MTPSSPLRHLWIWYTPFGLGGVETFLLQTARAYAEHGNEMCLAAVQSTEGSLRPSLEAAGVRLLDWTAFYPAYMNQTPATDIQRRMVDDLTRLQPSAIVLNGCTDFATGMAPVLRRLRPSCTLLDVFHIDPPNETYLKLRRPYLDVLDGVVSTNAFTCKRLQRLFPRTRSLPTCYIPCGAIVPDRPRRPPGPTLRLLYVGRLIQEQKRILELPAVLAALRQSNRPFEMTIVGDGPEGAELRNRLEQRGLLNCVSFAGRVAPERVMDYLFEHDVLLNLSAYEGFAISIIEAFAAGCVPVCTRLPSLDPAVFLDGQTCRLCALDRLEEMSSILNQLTPETLTLMSAKAQRVGRQLTVPRMTQAYRQFLLALQQRRPVRPWSAATGSALPTSWDMTKDNPWLPHPHPLSRWLRGLWTVTRQGVGRVFSRSIS